MLSILARTLNSQGSEFANLSENNVLANISESTVYGQSLVVKVHRRLRYCLISLTLPVDLCLYMGFLIAWRIVCSRASPGQL